MQISHTQHGAIRAAFALLLISMPPFVAANADPAQLVQISPTPSAIAPPPQESNALKATEKAYALTLVFVQNTVGQSFDAVDIPVIITNPKGEMVLQTTVQGPYLLIKLPPGTYKIRAIFQGTEQIHQVTTGEANPSARVVFDWK